MKRILLSIILLSFISCSSLMMSAKDRDEANKDIVLKANDTVSVLKPSIREAIVKKLDDAGWTEDRFASTLQIELVKELNRRGVNAQADSSQDNNFIVVHINEYNSGSGVARALNVGFGLGESKLEGTAILSTSEGKRELELKKHGQKSGLTEGGDQTSENIHYFASSLASRFCISSK